MIHLSLQDRFWSKVNKLGPIHPVLKTRCWLWKAHTTAGGYGHFKMEGKYQHAHRVAFFLKHGRWPIPHGLHKCDVRACCNPSHIFEGTHLDNMRDKIAKGRAHTGDHSGELNSSAKLTKAVVLKIRARYATKKVTQVQLASQFKVDQSQISHIVNGQHWRDS